jgi:hypothetical protein
MDCAIAVVTTPIKNLHAVGENQGNYQKVHGTICNRTSAECMKWACFSSVMTDSSNYLNLRLVPLIRYYHTEEGVIVKAFKFVILGGETSDLFMQKRECYDDVMEVSVGNMNTNFRDMKRKGNE